MKRLFTLLIAPLAIALSLLAAAPAFAGDAQEYLRGKHTELTSALKTPNAGRGQRVSALMNGMIDYDQLARETLGNNADGRSAAELTEFRGILEKLVRQNYERNIQKTINYTVTFTGEEAAQDGVLVHSKAETKKPDGSTETVLIDYRMHKKDGKWMITDIVTENSSMVRNYKNQFNKIIRRDGWNVLIQKLKKKVAQNQAV